MKEVLVLMLLVLETLSSANVIDKEQALHAGSSRRLFAELSVCSMFLLTLQRLVVYLAELVYLYERASNPPLPVILPVL